MTAAVEEEVTPSATVVCVIAVAVVIGVVVVVEMAGVVGELEGLVDDGEV